MFDWLIQIPLWLLGILLCASMFAAAWTGFALRKYAQRRDPDFEQRQNDTQEGYIVSAVLALLGLLIGFTFSLVLDRYEARRLLVIEDANAIETLYLRAQLLDEPHRSHISNLLNLYVDNHLALAEAEGPEAVQLLQDNRHLIADLWLATRPAFASIKGIDFSSAFVDSVNRVIELDTQRKAARMAQIPAAIFAVLFSYSIVSSLVTSYVLSGPRVRLAGLALLVLFTMTLMLISDINRPLNGTIRESQQPMQALRHVLRAHSQSALDVPADQLQPSR